MWKTSSVSSVPLELSRNERNLQRPDLSVVLCCERNNTRQGKGTGYGLRTDLSACQIPYGSGGGITANDALAIQKFDAGVIRSLPVRS